MRKEDIKIGDRVKVVGTYWSSARDSQEETVYVLAIKTQNGVGLYIEDNGKKFIEGANSSYEYYLENK